MIVTPGAALTFWKPGLESDLFDFAREFVGPGSVVWDLGANVGLFTFSAAHRAGPSGKVLAIEADTWLSSLLRKSVALQPSTSAPIQVLPVAVSNSLGIASFNIANRGRASNFLAISTGSSQTGGIRETVSVVTVTLDWLLEQGIPAPHVLKIDVEGAEAYVLQAAERVLSEARPILLCEVMMESQETVTDILRKHNYTLFNWEDPKRCPLEQACFNTLAIPSAASPIPFALTGDMTRS